MKLKIATYNISGGFYQDDQSVDFFDKEKANGIDLRLLNDIVKIINDEDIDIICFQEIITTESINYINMLMEKTNLKHESHFELSPCHIVKDTDCGVAILSKYPITGSIKKMFTNPKLAKTTSSGNTYYTFDKGLLVSVLVKLFLTSLCVKGFVNLSCLPSFKALPCAALKGAVVEVEVKLLTTSLCVKGFVKTFCLLEFN